MQRTMLQPIGRLQSTSKLCSRTGVVALRMAEAGPPGGTPVPVTCDVVFMIGPEIVACMSMGTSHDAPAPKVTLFNDQPLPLKTALPAEHVYAPTASGTRPAGYVS